MRIFSALALALCLAACNRGGSQNNDAVRQAIVSHLEQKQFSMSNMDMSVSNVTFNGNKAQATVSFAPKGAPATQGMSMTYQLEQQNGKWTVVGRNDAAGSPHAGAGAAAPGAGNAMPGMENPHGGAPPAMGGSGGSSMPSPDSLPPAGQKK